MLEGSVNIRDLETEYGLTLPRDAGFETLAGFILARLQRIPSLSRLFRIRWPPLHRGTVGRPPHRQGKDRKNREGRRRSRSRKGRGTEEMPNMSMHTQSAVILSGARRRAKRAVARSRRIPTRRQPFPVASRRSLRGADDPHRTRRNSLTKSKPCRTARDPSTPRAHSSTLRSG